MSKGGGGAVEGRGGEVGSLLRIVLHEPEIPNNTGNIGRTCVALGCGLDLIHPLGFDISEKACRRAGLDYWPRLDLAEHASWDGYCSATAGARRWLFTARADGVSFGRSVFDAGFRVGDHLVFGKETAGLPAEILEASEDWCVGFPMVAGERGLNVATAVCAAGYEAIRQMLASGEVGLDAEGRLARAVGDRLRG